MNLQSVDVILLHIDGLVDRAMASDKRLAFKALTDHNYLEVRLSVRWTAMSVTDVEDLQERRF